MAEKKKPAGTTFRMDVQQLDRLIRLLQEKGYETHGPVARDGVIMYDRIAGTGDLPSGYVDEQDRGRYRLLKTDSDALFGFVVGLHAWKKYLFPPELKLWQAERNGHGFVSNGDVPTPRNLALIGVRSCELHAIAIQDRIFTGGDYIDPFYAAQRKKLFLVAVNCSAPGKNCFCASMGTGPQATSGFDVCLTEIVEDAGHYFVVQAGSRKGQKMLEDLQLPEAAESEQKAAIACLENAVRKFRKVLDTEGLQRKIYERFEHPHWEEVAKRCLACGNCTMVCPTCFCTTVEDVTDLSGNVAQRIRKWDSCFNLEHSYIHGGSVRESTASRYRQWLTHKFATWVDQFGTMGCVGCGRCITWCPVGIDVTQEIKKLTKEQERVKTVTPVEES
jgi:ferredoxin